MADKERKKAEEAAEAAGAEWTDQEWPPYEHGGAHDDAAAGESAEKSETGASTPDSSLESATSAPSETSDDAEKQPSTGDGRLSAITNYLADHPGEIEGICAKVNGGEADPDEVRYYQENPDKLDQLAKKLSDGMESGAIEDASLERSIGVEQIERRLKEHPEIIPEASSIVYGEAGADEDLQNNPEEVKKLAEDLFDAMGDNQSESEQNAEAGDRSPVDDIVDYMVKYPENVEQICATANGGEADPDEVKYYHEHPEKLPQLAQKLLDKAGADFDANAVVDEVNAQMETEGLIDRLKTDPKELARICEITNHGLDEEELQYYIDNPDKIPQLVDKYNKLMAAEAGKDGDNAEDGAESADESADASSDEEADKSGEADGAESSDADADEGDDAKYEEWLKGANERGDDYYTSKGFEGESERANETDIKELHPRKENESDADYAKRLKWEEMMREATEKSPRFRALSEGEYPEGVDKEAYDEYIAKHSEKSGHFDGADETDEEWLARVGLPSLKEFMAMPEESGESEDGPKTRWGAMSSEERRQFIKDNPRLPGEKTEEWAKRTGLLETVDTNSDDAEKEKSKEFDREGMLRKMRGMDFQDWLKHRHNVNELEGMSDDELQKLYDEFLHRNDGDNSEGGSNGGGGGGEEVLTDANGEEDPLVAARINRERDARAAAHDIAERMLSERLASRRGIRGFVQRVIIGGMFREGTVLHYERRALEMIREKQNGGNVPELSDNDWATRSGLERFVQAYVQGYENEMIHNAAGESMNAYAVENDENGNQIVRRHWVDESGQRHDEVIDGNNPMHRATLSLRRAISDYAQGGTRERFEEAIGDLRQELRNAGGNEDGLMAENYMAVAEAARARFEHGRSIENVMAGFSFVNGEARSNVRTEAHRDAVDRLTNAISNSHIGRLLPPEVVGTAASLAVKYGRSGVRNALVAGGTVVLGATMAPAVIPVAVGAMTAGAFAAIKERNRVTGDRSTQARRLARGETIGTTDYDQNMEQAQYTQHSAEALTRELNDALNSGDQTQIRDALALVETATMMSDERGIDLIKYTSGDTDVIEQQRMDMDVARARAKAELRRQGVQNVDSALTDAIRRTTELFERDISAKDRAFRSLRRRRMVAQGFKSAATSGIMSVASQEVVSLFRDDQVGVLENLGIQAQENRLDAQNTLLAGALGFRGVQNIDAMAQTGAELTQEQIDQLRADGYTVVEGTPKIVGGETTVSGDEYLEANGARCTKYLGYDKGGSQGNELRGHFSKSRGPYVNLKGVSYGNGQSVDTETVTSDQVGFFATAGGKKFFIPATGSNGNFEPDYDKLDPQVADFIKSGRYGRIQCGYINGVTEDGDVDFSSFCSWAGRGGKFPSTVTSEVATAIPTWDVIGSTTEVERAVDGFPTVGWSARKNLTLGRRPGGSRRNPGNNSGSGGNGNSSNGGGSSNNNPPRGGSGSPRGGNPSRGGGSNNNPPRGGGNGGGGNPPSPSPIVGGGESMPPAMPVPDTSELPPTGPDNGDDLPTWSNSSELPPAGPANEDSPAAPSTSELPPTGPANAEVAQNNDAETSSDDDDEFLSEIPYEGPIRPNAINLYLTPNAEQIRGAASGKGLEVADADMRNIQLAIAAWNNMSEDHRRHFINGGRLYDRSRGAGFGGMSEREAFEEQRSAEILQRFGLVETGNIHSAQAQASEAEMARGGNAAAPSNEGTREKTKEDDDDDGDDEGGLAYDVPFTGTVSRNSTETRAYPSDEDIRRSAIGVGRNVDDNERQSIRRALFRWNTLEEEQRRDILNHPIHELGADDVEMSRVLSDYGIIRLPRFSQNSDRSAEANNAAGWISGDGDTGEGRGTNAAAAEQNEDDDDDSGQNMELTDTGSDRDASGHRIENDMEDGLEM